MLKTKYFGGAWGDAFRHFQGNRHSKYVCMDFSAFDSSLSPTLLNYTMDYMRTRFGPGVEATRLFAYYKRELIHTTVNTPSGLLYRKHRGVASGDPFTSLAGSYANWIALLSVGFHLGLDVTAWTFGDDSVMRVDACLWSNDHLLDALRKSLYELFGLKVKPSQSYVCDRTLIKPDEYDPGTSAVSFLSFYCTTEGLPFMSTSSLWGRVIHPERCRSELIDEYSTVIGLSIVYYANFEASIILMRVREYLEAHGAHIEDWSVHSFLASWAELSLVDEDVAVLRHTINPEVVGELFISGFIDKKLVMMKEDRVLTLPG